MRASPITPPRLYRLLLCALAVLCCASASFANSSANLVSISFIDAGDGAGGDNEHTVYSNSAGNNGWGDGSAISDPVWTSGGTNEPACYTRTGASGSKLKVQVVVNVSPSGHTYTLVGGGAQAYFRAEGLTSTGSNQTVM